LANHDPSFRVGLDSPKRGSRTSLDGRSRAHRGVRRRRLPFHGVPSHGENFNAHTNRRGCARASRRVPRLAFKLSRGSLLAGIADRSSIDSKSIPTPTESDPPPAKKTPRDIHERKTDFKSASSRTLQAGAALTITRPANAAYGDSANVFGSVSNPTGAFPMRCDAKPPACDFIHIQVVHSSIYVSIHDVLKNWLRRPGERFDDWISFPNFHPSVYHFDESRTVKWWILFFHVPSVVDFVLVQRKRETELRLTFLTRLFRLTA
jgi:hypothetical protein